LNWITALVCQSYKGHVTIVPDPTIRDYLGILENVDMKYYQPSFQSQYIQSLRKMALIKSHFGIEREFDRYYKLLKSKLLGGQDIDGEYD